MAIDLQQVKADFEGNTSICRATWAKVLDAALEQIEVQQQLVDAVKGSHQAIDRLMSRLIELDPNFMPSKSDAWFALLANGAALTAAGIA